jgi:hypothetical protein
VITDPPLTREEKLELRRLAFRDGLRGVYSFYFVRSMMLSEAKSLPQPDKDGDITIHGPRLA